MIIELLTVFVKYFVELLPFLAIGFFLSGLVHEFVPAQFVERHLGGKKMKPIFYATLVGTVLPICCMGALPVAISLHRKGARLGPVLAFIVATPATSITALLVCYGLLGVKFAVFIFFAVILMGLAMGVMGNLIKLSPRSSAASLSGQQPAVATDPVCGASTDGGNMLKTRHGAMVYQFCSAHCKKSFENEPERFAAREHVKNEKGRLSAALRYAFVDMVKDIGPELLLGLVLAALVSAVAPVGKFVGSHFAGSFGYLFSLIFGFVMYICSTASVPLAHAFISQGMNVGAAMVLLLAGPVTSWGTMLVLRKEFGARLLIIYLATIGVASLSLGYLFSTL